MPLIYTTVEAIARRLQGRLTLNGTPAMGGQTVDPELVEQCGVQAEDYMNLVLGQIYVLPLQKTHAILADVAESLTISKLMEVHFQGTSYPAPGADVAGAAGDLRRHAEMILQALTVGHGIYIPVMPSGQPTMPNMPQPQPLVLPGETLKADQPDTITRNVTVVGQRNLQGIATRIRWGGLEDFQSPGTRDGRAIGSENIWGGRRNL
ncbi:MAG TPA: hypothetical protein V6C65_04355 [Allocoleopsis sp.]